MSDEVLRLRGVEVRRDAVVLLRNVDWTVAEAKLDPIGPNGAGKTTCSRGGRADVPTDGTVEVLGERLARPTSSTCGRGSGWPARRSPTGSRRRRRSSTWC